MLKINSTINAQQLPLYSLQEQNPYILNPALAGIENFLDLKVGIRSQWISVNGSPKTYYFSANTTVSEDSVIEMFRHGLGGVLWHDKAGAISQTNIAVSYAYHKYLDSKHILALGASLGVTYSSLNIAALQGGHLDDPFISNINHRRLYPDISIGALYYSNSYYIGLSVKQLFPSSFFVSTNTNTVKENVQTDRNKLKTEGKRVMHSYVSMGYRYDLELFEAAPSITMRYIPSQPLSIDYNLKLIFERNFWVGGAYRNNNSFVAMAGVYLNTFFNFSYAYDFNFFNLKHFGSGAHELVLGFQIANDTDKCPKFVW